MTRAKFTVAGGGPVGSLLAILLARHGYRVGLYEGRPDSRVINIYQGKSINIALSDRGWHSLAQIGVGNDAKRQAIPMYHRAVHGVDGAQSELPYGKEGDAIWSVSRGGINEQLLDIAEIEPSVETHFEHRLVDVDFENATAVFDVQGGNRATVEADYLFGADGAHSKVRRLAHNLPRFSYSQTYMPQSYIELNIPANADGSHRLEKNALPQVGEERAAYLAAQGLHAYRAAKPGRYIYLHVVPELLRQSVVRVFAEARRCRAILQ
jgi:kynurenine 3-monooxygenase